MKKLFSFMTILMVFSIFMSSCGKDNESNGTSIVGTWKMTMEEDGDLGYILLVFNSNGIGYSEEWWYYQGVPILDESSDPFPYQYNSSNKELKIIYEDGDVFTSYCEVTDTRMILRYTDKGKEYTEVYVRQ